MAGYNISNIYTVLEQDILGYWSFSFIKLYNPSLHQIFGTSINKKKSR